MKFSFRSVGLVALLLALGVLLPVYVWIQLHTMSLTPESESVFLKDYAPQTASKPFERSSSGWGSSMSGSAGRDFIPHIGGYQGHFAICPQQWIALMNALKDNATEQLARDKAQILVQSGDPRSGFHFEYKIGKSVGSLDIEPLKIGSGPSAPVGNPGTVPVVVNIALQEKYFRKDPGLMTVSIETHIRN